MLSNIKRIIWDFDGTLYQMPRELSEKVRASELSVIATRMGWDSQKVLEEFEKVRLTNPSATATVAQICGIKTAEAAFETESLFNRCDYIEQDARLLQMFQRLHTYTHIILTNGYSQFILEAIKKLGLPVSTFAEIVTSETVGENKPNPVGFAYILKKYGFTPDAYLSVGDRVPVDLAPAKSLGMNTCLIGQKTIDNTQVDYCLSTIYEVPSLFTQQMM